MYSFDRDNYESELSFYQMDPSFFPRPTEPSPPSTAYAIGGAMIVGAAAWLLYSYAVLPRGDSPQVTRHERRWRETAHVEATGCGLVPADR